MNQEVYQEIRQEMSDQLNNLERVGQLMQKITAEEAKTYLEKIEASLEFFAQRMIFSFRNDDAEILKLWDVFLDKLQEWEKINDIYENDEYKTFIEKYFWDINQFLQEIINKADSVPKNNDRMGLVLIAKNEGRYLPEWIEYHKAVGINRFFIYDNESTDNTKEVLDQYIAEGCVTYTWCPGKLRQLTAYEDALDRFRFEVKYLGVIDTDEFILPVQGGTVPDTVDKLFYMYPKAGSIAVGWRIFGSDGQVTDNGKPVIGTFLHRADNSFWQHQHIKSICDPRKTLWPISPHHFVYTDDFCTINERGGRVNGPYDKSGEEQECNYLQINHYYVKSREYWIKVKMKKGFADCTGNYLDDFFVMNDRNEVEDKRMLKYLLTVERNLRMRGFLNE